MTPRRSRVDDVVKSLANGKDLTPDQIRGNLMRGFKVFEERARAENEALALVCDSNVLLAKTVGELTKTIAVMNEEIGTLKTNLSHVNRRLKLLEK